MLLVWRFNFSVWSNYQMNNYFETHVGNLNRGYLLILIPIHVLPYNKRNCVPLWMIDKEFHVQRGWTWGWKNNRHFLAKSFGRLVRLVPLQRRKFLRYQSPFFVGSRPTLYHAIGPSFCCASDASIAWLMRNSVSNCDGMIAHYTGW